MVVGKLAEYPAGSVLSLSFFNPPPNPVLGDIFLPTMEVLSSACFHSCIGVILAGGAFLPMAEVP